MTDTYLHTVTWPTENQPVFACLGTVDSACHDFPDCDCENWSEEHDQKHPRVKHETECWVLEWLNALGVDGYDEEAPHWGASVPRIDGPIDWEWDGDGLLWRYPDDIAEVPDHGDCAAGMGLE